MIVCMGAGDITKWAAGLADGDRQGEGGEVSARATVDCRATVRGQAASPMPRLRRWCGSSRAARPNCCSSPPTATISSHFLSDLDPATPVMALGLGSNMIVRDGGVPGVTVRLGKPFAKVERVDEVTLKCGGGASGILVSSTARDAGIAGLEFLRSIPGTVGGFVRMNGGAYGREM